jgi:FixJ family two-component response regulator
MDGEAHPQVLILDDSQDLCEAMSQLILLRLCAPSLCVHSFDQLTENHERALRTRIAFLDVNLGAGPRTGVDAYDWLKSRNYAGHIYFFSGHANTQLLGRPLQEGVRILSKPLPSGQLVELISAVLARGGQA